MVLKTLSFPISAKLPEMPSVKEVEFLVEEAEKFSNKHLKPVSSDEDDEEAELPPEESDDFDSENNKPGKVKLNMVGRVIPEPEYQPGAMDELMAMTGLEEVKDAIKRQLAFHKIMKFRKVLGHKVPSRLMHILLTGNPGTGKTTVARLIARIYFEEGLISKHEMVERSRGSLVGRYIGVTEEQTLAALKEAKGGVLFIDEIYSLAENENGDDQRDFGFKVIDTLMPVLSDPDSDIIVIGAGYKKEMKRFLSANSGLASRFPIVLNFKDFSYDQLLEITLKHLGEYDFRFSDEALIKLKELYTRIMKVKNFGNARTVMTIVDNYIIPNLCMRLEALVPKDVKDYDTNLPLTDVIEANDIPSFEEVYPLAKEKKRESLGFR